MFRYSNILDYLYLLVLALYFFASMISAPKLIIYVLVFILIAFTLYYLHKTVIKDNIYLKWFVLFIAFSCLSLGWSIGPYFSVWGVTNAILAFIPGLSIYLYIDKKKNLIAFTQVFIFTTILFIIYSISYFGFSSMGEGRFGDDVDAGLNSNTLAICLLYSIIGCVIQIYSSTYKTVSLITYGTVAVLMIYVMLMTGCRKTLLMLFAIPLFYYFLKSKRKLFAVSIIAVLLILGVYVLFSIPVLYDVIGVRLLEMVGMIVEGGDAEGDVTRFFLYKYGFEWFLDRPVLGRGLNTYRILSDNTREFWGFNWYAHSNLVELLVGVGLTGTILYFSWYVKCIRDNIRTQRVANCQKVRDRSLFTITLIVSYLLFELFAVTYYDWFSQAYIGIMFALTRMNKQQTFSINQK